MIASELLAARCPILRETSLQIADPQVRYCGTLGGNVANGDPGNDMPAVMMALDATYRVKGQQGERDIPARDFYQGIYATALGARRNPDRGPHPDAGQTGHGYAYEKQKRKIGDYATAAAAVVLTMSGGTCTSAAIALTNVADTPLFAEAAGDAAGRHRPRRSGDCRGRAPRARRSPARRPTGAGRPISAPISPASWCDAPSMRAKERAG